MVGVAKQLNCDLAGLMLLKKLRDKAPKQRQSKLPQTKRHFKSLRDVLSR